MTTRLGPHIVDSMYAQGPEHRGLIRDLVQDENPAWVNILRASQPQDALQTALEIRRDFPATRTMIRHRFDHLASGDENVMKVFPKASDYYREIGTQYLGLDVTLVAGNEIGPVDGESWNLVTDYFLEVGELAGKDGTSVALCRHSAWHPDRPHFRHFEKFGALYQKYPFHVHSPNVYWTVRPERNFDALHKALELWEFLGQPQMVIGEFARIYGYDPHKGFHWEAQQFHDINEVTAADEMIDIMKAIPPGICALWYALGMWPIRASTFHTGEDFTDQVVGRKDEIQLMTGTIDIQITATPSLRIRDAASGSGKQIGSVPYGTTLTVDASFEDAIGNSSRWIFVRYNGISGYINAGADFVRLVGASDPDPLPDVISMEDHLAAIALLEAKYIEIYEGKLIAGDATIARQNEQLAAYQAWVKRVKALANEITD